MSYHRVLKYRSTVYYPATGENHSELRPFTAAHAAEGGTTLESDGIDLRVAIRLCCTWTNRGKFPDRRHTYSVPFCGSMAGKADLAAGAERFNRPIYGEPALIVVPTSHSRWAKMIAKASAIVAFKNDVENLVVYYEGNLYGASNLHRFEDRASVAYGRMTQRAPTIAMAMVPAGEFVVVGHMTPGNVAIDKPGLLSQWNQEMAE